MHTNDPNHHSDWHLATTMAASSPIRKPITSKIRGVRLITVIRRLDQPGGLKNLFSRNGCLGQAMCPWWQKVTHRANVVLDNADTRDGDDHRMSTRMSDHDVCQDHQQLATQIYTVYVIYSSPCECLCVGNEKYAQWGSEQLPLIKIAKLFNKLNTSHTISTN